ncbi:MAG: peptidylprolyl isomerase [Anaerolineales bacterium]
MLLVFLAACGGSDADTNPEGNVVANDAPTMTPVVIVEENPTEASTNLAATVNGEPITLAELNRQIDIFRAGISSPAADDSALLSSVLERRIEQVLISQEAAAQGITISDEQVQAEIDALEAAAAEQGVTVEEFFQNQGITPDAYEATIRETLLNEAVIRAITADVPTTTVQVRARHILVEDLATAQQVLEQLNSGGDFVALAAEYSLDPSTRDAGGDLGLISPGDLLQAEVENAIFALPANARAPEPVQSVLGYHIIETIERVEGQPLDNARLAERRQQAWLDWLTQQRATAEIIRYVGPNAQP